MEEIKGMTCESRISSPMIGHRGNFSKKKGFTFAKEPPWIPRRTGVETKVMGKESEHGHIWRCRAVIERPAIRFPPSTSTSMVRFKVNGTVACYSTS
jgi:hypothetical protein